ncbi:MAG: DNA/RNA helicase domain-containing protein [Bacilli bacterium]|nr:DNA/RNA helicase domain-containing protein [Bacilli bacterium]
MSAVTFSTQDGKAYYYNNISDFLIDSSNDIIAELIKHSFELNVDQRDAWADQINDLKEKLSSCGMDGDIIFEYDIVRLGKRIDVILLIKHMVFSLEFKNGKSIYTAEDARQAEDYAIDIKNFHKESENLYVCPILIATKAKKIDNQSIESYADKQIKLQRENSESYIEKVKQISAFYGDSDKIDFNKWFNSPYYPTPSIIEAAIQAYHTHNITEIAHSEAGQDDIDECEKTIDTAIKYAKDNNTKVLCVVTGVPGAGKTLVGLDIVTKYLDHTNGELSVYLSGNGPLVTVLREALVKSAREFNINKNISSNAVKALIQGSFEFRKFYMSINEAPAEKILIFDEAQRVWNKEKLRDWTSKKMKSTLDISEPHFLVDVMNRHNDWAVIICLVGLGQDIYNGEVGINEWFKTIIQDFKDWTIFYSSKIFDQLEDKNIDREMIEKFPNAMVNNSLHLKTSIRSFRAESQSLFVDYLLNDEPDKAKEVLSKMFSKYPIYITRDAKKAKKWAKSQVRGSQRCGIIACSSAQRLKPEGIYVPTDIDVKNWFLAPPDDLRSSNMMEVVASEFKVQGLEIDWAMVCWDADLRRSEKYGWDFYNFKGTKWLHRNKEDQKRYLLNAYRVLLTRARQGMVIFVPEGVDPSEDKTRDFHYYNDIYNYLLRCGIKELE